PFERWRWCGSGRRPPAQPADPDRYRLPSPLLPQRRLTLRRRRQSTRGCQSIRPSGYSIEVGQSLQVRRRCPAGGEPRLDGARDALSKLANSPLKLSVGKCHLQEFLTVHRLSVLVLQLGDDLLGLNVDYIC